MNSFTHIPHLHLPSEPEKILKSEKEFFSKKSLKKNDIFKERTNNLKISIF